MMDERCICICIVLHSLRLVVFSCTCCRHAAAAAAADDDDDDDDDDDYDEILRMHAPCT